MKARQLCSMLLIALLTVFTLGLDPNEGWAQEDTTTTTKKKKKKKKKQTSSESSELSQVLKKVDKRILGYDTVTARELLEPVMGDSDPEVEAAVGRILMLEQKYDAAVTKLSAASRQSGDLQQLLYLGDAHAYAKQRGEADQVYQQVVQKAESRLVDKPGDADALYSLGVAQQRLKRYDPALQNLQQARDAQPKNELIAFELGMTHMLRSEFQPAFDRLGRAIELNSGFAYAYYYRGLAADKIGRKDIMVNDMDRFLALAPNAPDAPRARKILEAARG